MNQIALEDYIIDFAYHTNIDIAQEGIFFDDKNPNIKYNETNTSAMNEIQYKKAIGKYPSAKYADELIKEFDKVSVGFVKHGEKYMNMALSELKQMLNYVKQNNDKYMQAFEDDNKEVGRNIIDGFRKTTTKIREVNQQYNRGDYIFKGERVETPENLRKKMYGFFKEFAEIYKECVINQSKQYVDDYAKKSAVKRVFTKKKLTYNYLSKVYLWHEAVLYCEDVFNLIFEAR